MITWRIDTSGLKEVVEAIGRGAKEASRPAAFAGADVLVKYARQFAARVESKKPHFFYGKEAIRAPKGTKHKYRYGFDGTKAVMGYPRPFMPGNLRDSIYKAYSPDNSNQRTGKQTYHVSWNFQKAPYGFAWEFGQRRKGARPFLRAALSAGAADAVDAMKQVYIDKLLEKKGKW